MQFHGLSAFPVTPLNTGGEVDVAALEKIVLRLRQADVDSVGLLGSTGLYAFLRREEKRRAIEATVNCLQGSVPVMVSAGALRTDEAIALAQDAEEAGADALLLAPVSYTPLTEEEVFQHFVAVSESTSLPLCIYNNPGTTHFTFTPALLARLASLPGVKALKYPSSERTDSAFISSLRAHFPRDFALGFSVDWHAPEAMLAGGDTWYSVLGGLLPAQAMSLALAARQGDGDRLALLNAELQPMWTLFKTLSSLRVMYCAVEIMGICTPVLPRPLLPLRAEECRKVEAVLRELKSV
ncbi:dihydrodipicolinate synthase family protein [Erwinia pyri]|uniref:Dihydrodipicolinate synthase family protein n=1 Tax=Erwinia pyri TaxID=3062598 RepID=A0AA50DH14_9GAMM|nr:dihydrodipicolinate synthase family protein [Erwinia sp. DE2]WLS78089.1 dihydrodipicolinate synthase family protein [Erwinia sp. DE2]